MLLALFSCRKEIEHEIGSSVVVRDNNLSPSETIEWTSVTPAYIMDVFCLEEFNGSIYAGGDFENLDASIEIFARLDENDELQAMFDGDSFFEVYDLFVHNNELVVAGNFSYFGSNSSSYRTLMSVDLDQEFVDIPFTDGILDEVHQVSEYNGDMLVVGRFSPDSDNDLITENVELISNDMTIGVADMASGPVYSATVHDDELYICGVNSHLKKLEGNQWIDVQYNEWDEDDELMEVISYNSELFLLGNFESNGFGNYEVALKRLTPQGIWENVEDVVGTTWHTERASMKIIDNRLYVCTAGLSTSTSTSMGLLSYDGQNWNVFGNLNTRINDVLIHNGRYYIATDNGIFKNQ